MCALAAAAVEAAGRRIAVVLPQLSERGQRLLLGVEAKELGYGGVSAVAEVSGVARSTVQRGRDELEQPSDLPVERSRRAGAGRKSLERKDPGLVRALEALVDPATRGDPESPLRWTSKSTRQLAEALADAGHPIGERTTAALLHQLGYSLQANAKTGEGRQHPDRDAQFRYINEQVRRSLRSHDPVISVDTKKKELVGADPTFKNAGREWQPKGRPVRVGVHDFPDPGVPKAIPYGVYDLAANAGWVAVGCDGDTAQFAAETLRRWWTRVGSARYSRARRLLVCADAGGSNGYRVRLWKVELAKLADRSGLAVTVCHFPPGTSKWNKIEHRLFAHISLNWRGRPLISHEVVVELIGATTTRSGLTVHAEADTQSYPRGIKVSDAAMAAIRGQLTPHDFHGEWNYTVRPRRSRPPRS